MKKPVKVTLLSTLGIGMLTLGAWTVSAVRAQTVTSPAVDQPLPAVSTTATDITTMTTPTTPNVDRHQQRLDDMATLLGITSTQLQTELSSGKQFYQIAAEHGVTYDKLKANRDAYMKARLDDMVEVGYMTQAEADTAYQQYQTQSSQSMMGGMGFGHGFHGEHGF